MWKDNAKLADLRLFDLERLIVGGSVAIHH